MGSSLSSLKARHALETEQPPLLSLLTFSPLGNPLYGLTALQREFFFSSLFRLLQLQTSENEERVRQISGKMLPPVSSAVMAAIREAGREKTPQEKLERAKARIAAMRAGQAYAGGQEKAAGPEEGQAAAPQVPAAKQKKTISLPKTKQAEPLAAQKQIGQPMLDSSLRQSWEQDIERHKAQFLRNVVFKGRAGEIKAAQMGLAGILDEYARGDAAKAQSVISELESRTKQQEFEPEELSAVLLLVIEDQICAHEEAGIDSARPGGAASKVPAVPEKIQKTAAASSEIRLASVREMLRYYFMRHPSELRGALALALGMSEADSEDDAVLQAKLSAAISEIGAYAVSQKVLAAIKEQKELDTQKCLSELGYKYDREKKKLILGKRTCGKAAEARSIISLLLSKFKKPKK